MKTILPWKYILIPSLAAGIEMYDFVIYVYFSSLLSTLFFPEVSRFCAMLATFGVFSIGYCARPLGGVLFGYVGDRFGRKKSLLVCTTIMALNTVFIGLLPTYYQIGICAPVVFLILRIIQGLCVGGDLPGTITFISEVVPCSHRGLSMGILYFGVNCGILMALFVSVVIHYLCTPLQLAHIGWRLAFILGLILIFVGYIFRRTMHETKDFQSVIQRGQVSQSPIIIALQPRCIPNILKGIGLCSVSAVMVTQFFLYMPIFLKTALHMTFKRVAFYNLFSLILFSLGLPIMAYLSDCIGCRRMLLFVVSILFVIAWPMYALLFYGGLWGGMVAMGLMAMLAAAYIGPAVSQFSALYPVHIRYTSIAFSYGVSFSIFSGLTPLVLMTLAHYMPWMTGAVLYLLLVAFIGLVAVVSLKHQKVLSVT